MILDFGGSGMLLILKVALDFNDFEDDVGFYDFEAGAGF